MSFNIVDLVKDQISDQLLGQMGGVLGTESSQTSGALSGALPGLLSGLMKSSGTPSGAGALFDAVQKQDDGMLGNIGNLLGGSESSQVASQGSSLLSSLLGSGALGQLAGVVANFAGISRGNSSSLMGMLAPIIIGVIKKKVFDGGLNADSMASMLTGQSDSINAAMPQGFSDQLQSAGFFDSIAAEPVAAVSTPQATSYEAPAAPSGGGFMKWLLPLAAVLGLGYFGMQYMNKDAATKAAADAQATATEAVQDASEAGQEALNAAQEAMPEGVDLSEITGGIEGIFGKATETFSGVTDLDSATAAVPALEDVGSQVSGLTDVIGRLPDAAKGPVGSVISNGLSALQPIIDKVIAIPGVGPILEPIVGPMLETLSSLTGG